MLVFYVLHSLSELCVQSRHFFEFVSIFRNVFSVVLNTVRQTHHSIEPLPKLKLLLKLAVEHIISLFYGSNLVLALIEIGLSDYLVEDILLERLH